MKTRNVVLGLVLAMVGVVRGSDRIVVMISVDGLAGYYIDDPKAEMPNIRKLAEEGSRAASMKAVGPTVTWPNHTTLVTGVSPAKHGVVGNNYYDRGTGKDVQLIGDPVLDKEEIVRVPTIYDVAHLAGMRTAGVRWPGTRNAKNLDWQVPAFGGEKMRAFTTAGLMEEFKEAGAGDMTKFAVDAGKNDENSVEAFDVILRKHRPNLALLHVGAVDHTEHQFGPRSAEAYAAIKVADGQVGEVWEELKKDFGGEATLIVVSDHGFSPIEGVVLPNVFLKGAGLVEVKGNRVVGGKVAVVPQGGAAMVYVKDEANRDEVMKEVEKTCLGVEVVERVVRVEGGDVRSPDMIIYAKEGYVFGDTAAGAMSFVEKPEKKGSHGHDPEFADLHATFVAWGVGIKKGGRVGEISNLQVAPTIGRLLGVGFEGDGGVLEEVLVK